MTPDLNCLVGIPFKLNRKDFRGCDCRGIVWLYHKYVRNKEYPFSDGKRVFFRNPKKDLNRMLATLRKIAHEIQFNELTEGDVVILRTKETSGALGVCLNNKDLLHMDRVVGSCLTKLYLIKELFLYGFRLND